MCLICDSDDSGGEYTTIKSLKIDLDGKEPDANNNLVDVDDGVEATSGVLAVTEVTRLIVRKLGPGVAIGSYKLTWSNPAPNKQLQIKPVAGGMRWQDSGFTAAYGSSDVEYLIKLKPIQGAVWQDSDTVMVTLTHEGYGVTCRDKVKLVPIRVDVDVDADYDGLVSTDTPDDPLEMSPGGYVCLSNSVCSNRTEVWIRKVEPASWPGTVELDYSSALKLFDAPTSGNLVTSGTDIANSLLPMQLWAQGEKTTNYAEIVVGAIPSGPTDTNAIRVIRVDYDIHHTCVEGPHPAHEVAVGITPALPPGIAVTLDLSRNSGTNGTAKFAANGSSTISVTASTNLTVNGSAWSDVPSNMTMEARIGSCVCTSDVFTVHDVEELKVSEHLHYASRSYTNDVTQTDETNMIYVCQKANDSAVIKIHYLDFRPADTNSKEYLWDIALPDGTVSADWSPSSGVFDFWPPLNYVTSRWTLATTPPTNRKFVVRAWFDCENDDTYTNTEPHRTIHVTVVDTPRLTLTNTTDEGTESVEDATRADETATADNTLFLCEGTNGTAEMRIELDWEPDDVEGAWLRYDIRRVGGTSLSSQWAPSSSGTFANTNAVLVTWYNIADSITDTTNRQFQVRAWYDCDMDGVYDSDEPHRSLFVSVVNANLTIDSDNDGSVDSYDEMVEDASPFLFWVNDNDTSSSDADNHTVFAPSDDLCPVANWNCNADEQINGIFDLIDLAPVRIHIDSETTNALAAAGYKLSLRSDRVRYFVSSKANTQDGVVGSDSYLFKEARANDQITKGKYRSGGLSGDIDIPWTDIPSDGNIWLLFEATARTLGADVRIELVARTSGGTDVFVADSVKLDFRYSKEFFRTDSVRGSQTMATYDTERLEDGGTVRTAIIDQYPMSPNTICGSLMHGADTVLVFVHGYANDQGQANSTFQDFYKKLYRNGFRNDMVGLTWHGDQGDPIFDPNVENAFESSKGLMNLIKSLKTAGKTVHVSAHSLGNLVMMDSLRRLALANPTTEYVKNVIHVEAAVWDVLYDTRPAGANGDFSDREADQRAEWTHWCADVPNAIAGRVVNSYNALDAALLAMAANDLAMPTRERWPGPPPLSVYLTYKSWALARPTFRTPNRLAYYIPANPNPVVLSAPMGTGAIPQTWFANHSSYNASSSLFGWRPAAHSDYRKKAIHEVYLWYRIVVRNNAN